MIDGNWQLTKSAIDDELCIWNSKNKDCHKTSSGKSFPDRRKEKKRKKTMVDSGTMTFISEPNNKRRIDDGKEDSLIESQSSNKDTSQSQGSSDKDLDTSQSQESSDKDLDTPQSQESSDKDLDTPQSQESSDKDLGTSQSQESSDKDLDTSQSQESSDKDLDTPQSQESSGKDLD